MLLVRGYFLCSLPYQIAIREGLLKRTAVENLMQENTFDPVSFAIEMECKWFGGVKDGYFDLEEITFRSNIEIPVYPSNLCKKLGLVTPKFIFYFFQMLFNTLFFFLWINH